LPRRFAPRMYENAAVCQGAKVLMLFCTPFIPFGHLSLEAVSRMHVFAHFRA
jgi:hypothetical protein